MWGMNLWPTRRYEHRAEAGEALAELLSGLEERPCVVAALPRGGVPVAVPIARALHAPLTLSFVRKVALPRDPELAVGAMDEDAHVLMNAGILTRLRAFPFELGEARKRAARELARQRELSSGEEPAGEHVLSWDGADSQGRQPNAGIYVMRLDTPAGTLRRKFVRTR